MTTTDPNFTKLAGKFCDEFLHRISRKSDIGLTTNTTSQTDGGRGHHIGTFLLRKERPIISQQIE